MPAEAIRLQRRVGARDLRFLAVLVAGGVIATPTVLLLQHHGSAPPRTGVTCIAADHAGVMGFGTYRYCGSEAATFCRRFAPTEPPIAAKCSELGLPFVATQARG